jgi:ADP-ribosylglycohydrolase
LWGIFIGDALSMPVHWYYNRDNIRADFNGGITGYEAAKHPHPESHFAGTAYSPDVEQATKSGRPYDILHEHVRFYDTTYSEFTIEHPDRDSETGRNIPALEERYHYHHGLTAGDYSLNSDLARVLMRSVIAAGRYRPEDFIQGFIEHMTTPGRGHDPYTEYFVRCWFENYSRGLPVHACAHLQRELWLISGHGALHRPLMVGLMAPSAYQGYGLAIEHQVLTHHSETVSSSIVMLSQLLHALIREGADVATAVKATAAQIQLPEVDGQGLLERDRDAGDATKIPADEMWAIHTRFSDAAFDLETLVKDGIEDVVVKKQLATTCHPEHGMPLMFYIAASNGYDFEATLLHNANAGGDNVNRALTLGMVVGAACDEIPAHLKSGLRESEQLEAEIEGFADIALAGHAF